MGNCCGGESRHRRESGVELANLSKKNISKPLLVGSSLGFEDPVSMPEAHIAPSRTHATEDSDLIAQVQRRAQTSTGSSMPKVWDVGTAGRADQKSHAASSPQNKEPSLIRHKLDRYKGEPPVHTVPGSKSHPPLSSTPAPTSAAAPSFGTGRETDESQSYDQDTSSGPTVATSKTPARYRNKRGGGRQASEEASRGRDASDPSQVDAALEAVARERPTAGPRSSSDPSRLQSTSTRPSSKSSDSKRFGPEGPFRLDERERRQDRGHRGG